MKQSFRKCNASQGAQTRDSMGRGSQSYIADIMVQVRRMGSLISRCPPYDTEESYIKSPNEK